MRKYIAIACSLVMAITFFVTGPPSEAKAAADGHRYCLSASANRFMYFYPDGYGNTNYAVQPGECLTVYGINSDVRIAIKGPDRVSFRQAYNGGAFGSCHVAPYSFDPINTFDNQGLWIRAYEGEGCTGSIV